MMISSDGPSFVSLHGVSWGEWQESKQILVINSPPKKSILSRIFSNRIEGLLVNPYLLLMIGFSGGNLKAPPEVILEQLKSRFRSQLSQRLATPLQQVITCLSWLEQENHHGVLERCIVGLILIIKIDRSRLWIWRVGGNGILTGGSDKLRFTSIDHRQAEFRRQKLLPPRQFSFNNDSDLVDDILPVFDLTTPDGYESFFVELNQRSNLVVAFNQNALPFGPWPTLPQDISDIWSLEAGWKHGLPAQGRHNWRSRYQ